jgi:hypothetical protein
MNDEALTQFARVHLTRPRIRPSTTERTEFTEGTNPDSRLPPLCVLCGPCGYVYNGSKDFPQTRY